MNGNLTAELKRAARDLGFDAVGIAPAAPLELAERAIRERVESGLLRDYGFARMPPDQLTRPERALPGAKSIIAVAWSYLTDEPEDQSGEPRGRVARFARGRDYHTIIEERLRELGEWLSEKVGGARYRICVDSGPIIDRASAREAGIGSYGKNATIITREAGSWVGLGELITDVELDYDEPAPLEECGSCSVCLSACPSGAIVRPFVLDQTKCISHVTQMKGFIPHELRPLIGDRIYGCDVCQEVCPKNANVHPRNDRGRDTSLIPHSSSLIPLLNIEQDDFDRLIGPTAIAWIGRTSLRKNAAVALGNIGDPAAVPALIKALEDSEPVIRGHAAWALGRIATHEAGGALQDALGRETDQTVVDELKAALDTEVRP